MIGAVTLDRHSKNMDTWSGEIQFYCEPLKEKTSEAAVEITTSGTTITNPGDVESRPLITITGSGDVTIRIGSNSISITGSADGWMIDSDTQWVMNAQSVPQMGVYTGNFPVMAPGNNTVQFTGSITKLTIEGRWRYL